MITIGQPRHLGSRTLLLLLARCVTPGVMLLVLSGVVAVIAPYVAGGFGGAFTTGGLANPQTTSVIYQNVSYIDMLVFLASIIMILAGIIVGLIQFRNYFFTLTEFDLKFRRGIFNQMENSIPYRQIQDINLVRTIAHRIFGVSRLVMISAGHEQDQNHDETDTVFDPIDADIAMEIRTFLERRIGIQIVEDVAVADKESGVTLAEAATQGQGIDSSQS